MTLPRAMVIRYASLGPCPPERCAPPNWLGAEERREFLRLRDANRRRQWLAGRWLGKQLVLQTMGESDPLAEVRIVTRDERGRGVRPRIFHGLRELDCTLSISHSDRGVLVALAPDLALSVGVDLASAVPTSSAFRRLWFTPSEQRWLGDDPPRRTRVLWAIKEAVYKAANHGESWDPRQIEVLPMGPNRFECLYRGQRLRRLTIDLQTIDDQLAAVACLPRDPVLRNLGRRTMNPTNLNLIETHHDRSF